jgi:xylulokinase
VLEGVAFGLKDGYGLIQKSGAGEIHSLRVSGGGAKGGLWRQILASVLNRELESVNTTEGAAYGAALLAGAGAGAWADVPSACKAAVRITGSTRPDPEQMAVYRDKFPLYRDLYPALKGFFQRM